MRRGFSLAVVGICGLVEAVCLAVATCALADMPERARCLAPHDERLWTLDHTPGGTVLVTGSADGTARIVARASGRVRSRKASPVVVGATPARPRSNSRTPSADWVISSRRAAYSASASASAVRSS